MTDLLLLSAKSISHIVVALISALIIQLMMPQAREIRVYVATGLGSIVVGFLASLSSGDGGFGVFVSHSLSALGGAFIYGIAKQFVLINSKLSDSDNIADAVIKAAEDKISKGGQK